MFTNILIKKILNDLIYKNYCPVTFNFYLKNKIIKLILFKSRINLIFLLSENGIKFIEDNNQSKIDFLIKIDYIDLVYFLLYFSNYCDIYSLYKPKLLNKIIVLIRKNYSYRFNHNNYNYYLFNIILNKIINDKNKFKSILFFLYNYILMY